MKEERKMQEVKMFKKQVIQMALLVNSPK